MDIVKIIMSNKPEWSHRETMWLVIILVTVGIAACLLWKAGKIKLSQVVSGMLLLTWLLYVAGSTVLTRESGVRIIKTELFWSWKEAAKRIANTSLKTDKRFNMLLEILLNMVMLLPSGFLLPLTMGKKIRPVYGLLFGLMISASIEFSQLILCRGFFEYDDMFGNTLGSTLGCVIGNRLVHKK